jgi:hypothetical protein
LAGAPLAAFGTLPINARSRRFIHFVQQYARARGGMSHRLNPMRTSRGI